MNKIAASFILTLLLVSCKDETRAPAEPGWHEIFDWGSDEDTYAFATSGATIYVSTNNGLYRSDNNGQSWVEIANPFEDQFGEGPDVLLGSAGKVFAARNYALFSSVDFGLTWQEQSTFTPEFGTITSLEASTSYLFAGTNNGQLFRSADLGKSWVNVLNGGQANDMVSSIAIDGSTLFVFLKGRGLRISTDHGDSWQDVSGGLGPFGDGAVCITEKEIFTAASGLYRSENKGETWIRCSVFYDEKLTAISYDVGTGITSLVESNGILYAVAGRDLFYSGDAGVSFHKIPSTEEIVNGSFRLFSNTFFIFGLDQHRLCGVSPVKT